MRLTKHQKSVLKVLSEDGRIFEFDFPYEVGLDDKNDNTLRFMRKTFDALKSHELIEVKSRPSIGCQVYGLSKRGEHTLRSFR